MSMYGRQRQSRGLVEGKGNGSIVGTAKLKVSTLWKVSTRRDDDTGQDLNGVHKSPKVGL